MRPAIGGFHIFPALRLAVMPSPYITEITPEMQQKIKIFAEKGVPAPQKSKSAQAFLLQKSILAAPCKGLAYGPQAARRTGGQANRRFASAASPPGLRPAPPQRTSLPPARRGKCEGGTIAVPPSRFIRAGAFKSAKRYALPPAPAKKTPFGVFFAGAADGN